MPLPNRLSPKGSRRSAGRPSKRSASKLPVFGGGRGIRSGIDPNTLKSVPGDSKLAAAILDWRAKYISTPSRRELFMIELCGFLAQWESRHEALTAWSQLRAERAHRSEEASRLIIEAVSQAQCPRPPPAKALQRSPPKRSGAGRRPTVGRAEGAKRSKRTENR